MATSAQIKALVESHTSGDSQHFYAIALQVAASEARKGHAELARELRQIVQSAKERAHVYDAQKNLVHIAQPQGELADLLSVSHPTVRLVDLVLDTVVFARLQRLLKEQRHMDKLRSHDLRPRQSLLLTGPPGCGKTLTASAIAGELSLPLFIVRLEALITRFLGETANKLRLIFEAVERTRAVYLFDEFDSIGTARGSEQDVGEMRRILNSFLVFVERHRGSSLLIAATNHGHLLDKALFRRFDDVIEMGLPTRALAEKTFRQRLSSIREAHEIDFHKIAEAAEGLSYAEITRICEEAIKHILLEGASRLTTADVINAISERRVFVQRPRG